MKWRVALVALLCWTAAIPPGWLPVAGWLIFPGLAAFYSLATSSRRPLLLAYLVGAIHLCAFSWSLRHVVWWGWLAMGLAAGLYYQLIVVWCRGLAQRIWAPLAFGVAVAVSHWLRSSQPELYYPHGQPIHCLYHWPATMGIVRWGGEVLGNLFVAALAAAAVELYRSWRCADPLWRPTVRRAAALGVAAMGLSVVPPPAPAPGAPSPPVAVISIEPGWRTPGADWQEWLLRALVEPSEAALAAAESPPDLLLWPETSYPGQLLPGPDGPRVSPVLRRPRVAPKTRFLVGTTGRFAGGRTTPVAVMLDHRAVVRGWHEKLELVPMGEFLPFVQWLPDAWREALKAAIAARMGGAPSYRPGVRRPLPATATGVPLGALLCYDNAFPRVARHQVAAGARLLVVLSNEAWYRGGDELDQLVAMSVCRVLETATPMIRCTIDGATVALAPSGEEVAALPCGPTRPAGPRVLAVSLYPGPGALPPLTWLHAWLGPALGLTGILVAWQIARSWARMRVASADGSHRLVQETVP